MVHREIGGIIEAVKNALNRLSVEREAQNTSLAADAEEDLCLESRTLFARYIDIVLWSGEFDKILFRRVEGAINASVEAVVESHSEAAESIRLRSTEFQQFARKHELRWQMKQSDKLLTGPHLSGKSR